jgi:hypothetical protein
VEIFVANAMNHFNKISGSDVRNSNINVLNEVHLVLHYITAEPALMFGLEVWFVKGKNRKGFETHEITFRSLIAGYTRTLRARIHTKQ